MTTTKYFASKTKAIGWLFDNCALWAGLSAQDQNALYDLLDEEGAAAITTPLGDELVVVIDPTV